MSLNISSYAGTMTGYAEASRESNRFGINKNSAQYKAAVRDNLSDIIANEATRSSVYEAYQKATPIDDRLKGSWTLQQYENVYWQAMCSAVKAVNPDWQAGQPFDTSIINNLSREDIEACIQQSGSTLSYQRIDYSA